MITILVFVFFLKNDYDISCLFKKKKILAIGTKLNSGANWLLDDMITM